MARLFLARQLKNVFFYYLEYLNLYYFDFYVCTYIGLIGFYINFEWIV